MEKAHMLDTRILEVAMENQSCVDKNDSRKKRTEWINTHKMLKTMSDT